MSDTEVSTSTDPALLAAMADVEGAARTVVVGGHTFTLRSPCNQGALSVFAIRLQDKNPMVQATATMRLLQAWIVPEEHPAIEDMMEQVPDLDVFMETDLAHFASVATARPTSAPSS